MEVGVGEGSKIGEVIKEFLDELAFDCFAKLFVYVSVG